MRDRYAETMAMRTMLNGVVRLKVEGFEAWLNLFFSIAANVRDTENTLNMRLRLEKETIVEIANGRRVVTVMKDSFDAFNKKMKESEPNNLSRNFKSFLEHDVPQIEECLKVMLRPESIQTSTWSKYRQRLLKILVARIQRVHPRIELPTKHLEIAAKNKGCKIHSQQVRLLTVNKEDLTRIQAYYGYTTGTAMLNDIFMYQKPGRSRGVESQYIVDNLTRILNDMDTNSDEELLNVLVNLNVEYHTKGKVYDKGNSTRKLGITESEYKELHGNLPASGVFRVRMLKFLREALPDYSKLNRNELKKGLLRHMRNCAVVSSLEREKRQRLNFFAFLGNTIIKCYDIEQVNSNVAPRCIPANEVKLLYINAGQHPLLDKFRYTFGFLTQVGAMNYLFDPERKFS